MTEEIKWPAYRIITPRLVIRCWNPQDAPLLKAAIDENIDHLLPYMPWAQYEPELVETKAQRLRRFRAEFDLDQNYIYGIFNRSETEVLGGTGLHPRVGSEALEIGYWISQRYTRQGLATETAAALTKVAFELHHVRRMEIHMNPQNTGSAAVPPKLGYTYEATLRKRFPYSRDDWHDSMIWSLFAEDYPQTPSAQLEIEAYDVLGRRML